MQCWPGPPDQAFPPSHQLLCLCLFKLIQTPPKPREKLTAALVRKLGTSGRMLNIPGGRLGSAVHVQGEPMQSPVVPMGEEGYCAPGLGGTQKTAGCPSWKHSPVNYCAMVSTENPKTAPGLWGSHLLSRACVMCQLWKPGLSALQSLSGGR